MIFIYSVEQVALSKFLQRACLTCIIESKDRHYEENKTPSQHSRDHKIQLHKNVGSWYCVIIEMTKSSQSSQPGEFWVVDCHPHLSLPGCGLALPTGDGQQQQFADNSNQLTLMLSTLGTLCKMELSVFLYLSSEEKWGDVMGSGRQGQLPHL